MPLQTDENLPTKFPNPDFLTLDNFKRGVITLVDKSRLPKNALEEANNIFLVEDGQPSLRPGVDWWGSVSPNAAAIDGVDYFDFGGVIHLVMVAGGTIYRSLNDGTTWEACTGGTFPAGVQVSMLQNNNFLYLTAAGSNIIRYDGSNILQTYVVLSTPAAATITPTGLTGTNFTVYYKTAAVNQVGFSIASAKVAQQVSTQRGSWDATTRYLTLNLPAPQPTQTRTDIYYSEDDLNYYYLDSVTTSVTTPNNAYKDDGTAVVVPSTLAPTGNTTQGPKVAELVNVGSRMYGTRDPDNRYRIWFSGGNASTSGAFSNAYDGGYLDWQPGGKYLPVHVEDYRDGKGTPLATIWCKSADGQGCVLQMSLDTFTVGNISVTIPSAYKLPGSRGTPAPGSVVNVLNDYYFYNSQAFYNLGSRAQFLNLLSTDEASADIRPSVKQISTAGEANIASAYNDAKVFFSVGYGAAQNNATIVYDTERKAWLPKAFTIGFKKFLRYTSTNSDGSTSRRLLALKPGDNRLSEISSAIQGDYGVAFQSSLSTGLYPISKNRFEFQWTEEAEVEFSNPQGTVTVELSGIDRTRGYRSIKTANISTSAVVTTTGWDTFDWDVKNWDDTSVVPTTYSESSTKRYFNIQKELNAVQWRVTTNSLDARYVLRTLQSWGTRTEGGHPRQWRVSAS